MKDTYLITGGTGSFGKAFLTTLLKSKKKIKRFVIFSRDEFKQSEMQLIFPKNKYPFLRFFIGDVRDYERLLLATKNIEIVIHAAALKQVPAAEYNPFEAVKTNILGSQNVINACLTNKVKKVLALSTDKACSPINLYGATKLCSDKLFTSANNIRGNQNISFSVVRYGNVFGSRGSVYNVFKNYIDKGYFPITDEKMTRFSISLEEATNFVLNVLKISIGGEIFIPKIRSLKVIDLAKAMNSKNSFKIIGVRPGEKIHEQMINSSDSENTFVFKNFYAIVSKSDNHMYKKFYKKNKHKKVPNNFEYSSEKNGKFLTIAELKKIIRNY
jgi:UDP-N-acetylglucosamine 4,6-dehydratase